MGQTCNTIGAVSGYGGLHAAVAQHRRGRHRRQYRISGWSYDAAGNLLTYPGYGSYTYDAENRMTSTAGVPGYGACTQQLLSGGLCE